MKNKGFSLVEMLIYICIPFVIILALLGIYVLMHFIMKFW